MNQRQAPEDVAQELRVLIREAHEAMRGIREERREFDRRVLAVGKAVDVTINDAVAKGLASYKEALGTAIETGVAAVYARFDTLTAILLGEDPQSRSRGAQSLEELIRRQVKRMCSCEAYGTGLPHALECPVRRIIGEA